MTKQNEHIEYFKRWAAVYLSWAYSNFDRIVRDAVKRERTDTSPHTSTERGT